MMERCVKSLNGARCRSVVNVKGELLGEGEICFRHDCCVFWENIVHKIKLGRNE